MAHRQRPWARGAVARARHAAHRPRAQRGIAIKLRGDRAACHCAHCSSLMPGAAGCICAFCCACAAFHTVILSVLGAIVMASIII